ncbi:MAG: ATP-binding protein [Candidatus Sumerlaeota bacterium]
MRSRPLHFILFISFLLVTLLGLAVAIGYTSVVLRESYETQAFEMLEADARLFAQLMQEKEFPSEPASIQRLARDLGQAAHIRFTVIRPDGRVIADTDVRDENVALMDNHLDRREVQDVLRYGSGRAIRPSPTLGTRHVYYALLMEVPEGQSYVVRASKPLLGLEQTIRTMRNRIILGGLVVIGIIAALSFLIARIISQPVREARDGAELFADGKLDHRLAVYGSAEVRELAITMNKMAKQLRERIDTITEQQSQMQAMFSSMSEGFILLNDEGRIVQLNQSAERMLGIELTKALGTHVYEVLRQPGLLRFVDNLMGGNSIVEADLETHIGGESQVIRARGKSILNSMGERTGALIALYNLTRLTRLESMRKDFVANVSHELNTPVTAISVAADTLSEGALDDPEMATRFVNTILQNRRRLSSLIDDLLALGRLEEEVKHDAVRLEKQPLLPTVRRALEKCEGRAEGKNIAITLDCDASLEVWQNSRLLQRAVHNLVDNAIRHSEAGTQVRIAAETLDEERVLLKVSDNGPGIPQEHLDRLFERFYRVDNSRSRQVGGTGLGLALVKYIALAHHGQVDVESKLGEGSTFIIQLHSGETV